MTELPLFERPSPPPKEYDSRPHRRDSDPHTSHEAAARVARELGERQRATLEAVRAHPGLTRGELAAADGLHDPHTHARRLTELDRLGKVRRGDRRVCRVTGFGAATWWPA